MATILVEDMIKQLNDLHDGDVWLDETFAKKFEQINETDAFTRPLHDLHSPAELISHLIVWRRAVMDRLKVRWFGWNWMILPIGKPMMNCVPPDGKRLKKNCTAASRRLLIS